MAFERPGRSPSDVVAVAALIARREYGQAIERLKLQLQRRPLDPHTQLSLADALVQAGRSAEAVPVFMELAGVFAAEGFFAKAVAVLKRVDKIAPGRADVRETLAACLEKQRGVRPDPLPPPRPVERVLEFGMEEIGTETMRRLRAPKPSDLPPEPEPEPEPPSPPAEPVVEPEPEPEPLPRPAEPVVEALVEPVVEPVVEPIVEAVPEPTAPDEIVPAIVPAVVPGTTAAAADVKAPEPAPDRADEIDLTAPMSVRLRGLMSRVLSYVRGPGGEGAPAPVPEASEAAPSLDGPIASPSSMSSEEFHSQVLDLVQDLAQQPAQPRPPEPTEATEPGDPPVPAALFDSTALLAALTPDEILALVGELGLVRAEAGDVIVTEGEPGDSLFLVGSGRLKVFVASPGGRRFVVGELRDGDFFGEIATLSRRPRAATVTAAEDCDLLRLDRSRLEVLTGAHPHLREVLEDFYVRRAGSPAAAAVRVLPAVDAQTERRAADLLDAYFGESRWDPRVRLRLAQALARAGQEDDAVAILATLADEMARGGFPEKAVALFKKIEGLAKAPLVELKLAPLERPRFREEDMRPGTESAKDELGRWLAALARDHTTSGRSDDEGRAAPGRAPHAYTGLRASPLFEGLGEDDRRALVSGLELRTSEPGDVLVTEGETGDSIFVLASGSAKVYVRDADGRSVPVGGLPEGSFFGEVAALSGGVRRASVVASARCELLTLTRAALEAMTSRHPRIREVLEQYYAERTRT